MRREGGEVTTLIDSRLSEFVRSRVGDSANVVVLGLSEEEARQLQVSGR